MWTKGRRRRALLTLLVLGAAVCSASFLKPKSDLKARRHRVVAYDWDYYDEDEELTVQPSGWTALLDWVLRREKPMEPHPMRMERWAIVLNKFPFGKVERCMEFHTNGRCEVLPPNSVEGKRGKGREVIYQGKWRYDKYGLNWELDEDGVKHYYHAELIWHSFGERPKMHCGVVVRDRTPYSILPTWLLRPVVATFYGYGNGTDTYTAEGFNDGRFDNY